MMVLPRLVAGLFQLLEQIYHIVEYYFTMPSGTKRALEGEGAVDIIDVDCTVYVPTSGDQNGDQAGSINDDDNQDAFQSDARPGEEVHAKDAPANVTDVLDRIGSEIYKYLHPKDLLYFSLASHHVYEEVSKGIIQACLRQMPANFGSYGVDHCATETERINHIITFNVDHLVKFNERHSFPRQERLLDHLLDKVRTAELKLVGCEDQSMEESLAKARELLREKKGVKFFSLDCDLPTHLRKEYTSAGSHYERDNKKLATSRAEYILSRMKKESEMSEHIPIVRTWIEYILAQRHVVAGTWFWSCRHRNLDFQGVEGKGVMISSPRAEGEEMEICWTRLTASRV